MKKGLTLTALFAALALGSAQAQKTFTVVRAAQWGAQNFNPFVPGDQHLLPTNSTIYESLFYVNTLNGKTTPVLGTKYAWSNGNKTLTVTTQGGVKWHDGTAMTAKDVAFTYNYLKKFPALDVAGLWKNGLSSVTARDANTVVFNFSQVNTPMFPDLVQAMIVPEHIWSKITDPMTEPNAKPVGTGPFTFDTYSQQALRVVKNPNYWIKGKPEVDAIVWLATNSNDAAMLKLLKGEADYGYIGLTDPLGFSKKPNAAIYWPVDNYNYMYFNTAKKPLDDAALRRGMSMAINTANVAQKAYAGIAKAAHTSGIIPGQQADWLAKGTTGLKYDPVAADKALTAAGYKKDAKGNRLGKDGKPLPTFKILVGAGWTDFITMATVIGQDLKKVGINTSIDQQAWSSYAGGLQTGTYDLGISWGWGFGPTPYYMYDKTLSPEYSAPIGKTAASNLSRYTNPEVTRNLQTYSGTSDLAAQKKAIAAITKVVMRDMPYLALTDRSEFSNFNTSRFTGFPSNQNPYNHGTADDTIGARLMYLNIKAK